jgi:hypothetical protein
VLPLADPNIVAPQPPFAAQLVPVHNSLVLLCVVLAGEHVVAVRARSAAATDPTAGTAPVHQHSVPKAPLLLLP